MSPLRKVITVIFCFALLQGVTAQKALKKAERYAQLGAPFLSIKYLHKYLAKKENDKAVMLQLASTYREVNMQKQAKQWLLKAHDSSSPYAFYKKIKSSRSISERLRQTGAHLFKNALLHKQAYLQTKEVRLTQVVHKQKQKQKEELLLSLKTIGKATAAML